jgi:hypothetical protein
MDALAQDIYDYITAVVPDTNGDLATYVGALGDVLFQEVDDYAAEGPNGERGWSILLDIDRIPDKGLPWIAQFVGVDLPDGISAVDQRTLIADTAAWKRGTVDALRGAVKPYLTGSKNVLIRERYDPANPGVDSPGHIQVITYESQTPVEDWAATNALPNPGFEVDMSRWTNLKPSAAVSRDPTVAKSGVASAKVVAAGTVAREGLIENGGRYAVIAGKPYAWSVQLLAPAGTRFRISVDWYTAATVYLSSAQQTLVSASSTNWQRLTALGVAPATATQVDIWVATDDGTPQAVTYWIDEAQFEQNSQATPYTPNTRAAGSANMLRALLTQKAAGLILHYAVLSGQDFQALKDNNIDFAAIRTKYVTFQGVRDDTPGA